MTLVPPRFAPIPSKPDIVVVGAGAAGIAAARRLLAAGLSVAVLEARERVGGRAHTVRLSGHPVDLGAHWLHAGPINPLVALGRERGEPLRRAPQNSHAIVRGRFATPQETRGLHRAFDRADVALTARAASEEDRSAASVLPPLGRYGHRVAGVLGLVSGRPLDEISLRDYPSMEYSENLFIAGGLGAYIARLAQGLPIVTGRAVTGIDWSGDGVQVHFGGGGLAARAVLVTIPVMTLAAGGLRFTPDLPGATRGAIAAFRPGIYEHVVLNWPSSPFRGADRLVSFLDGRDARGGMLSRIDGTAIHYVELDQPTASAFDGRDPYAAARHVRAALAARFGPRAIGDLRVLAATVWRTDPWSLGSWAVVPPGAYDARDVLCQPANERIWFAGEAQSRAQWGTAGGAWEQGEWAAGEIAEALRGQTGR